MKNITLCRHSSCSEGFSNSKEKVKDGINSADLFPEVYWVKFALTIEGIARGWREGITDTLIKQIDEKFEKAVLIGNGSISLSQKKQLRN